MSIDKTQRADLEQDGLRRPLRTCAGNDSVKFRLHVVVAFLGREVWGGKRDCPSPADRFILE